MATRTNASIRDEMKAAKKRDAESKARWGTGLPGGIEGVQRKRKAARVAKAYKKAERKFAGRDPFADTASIFNPPMAKRKGKKNPAEESIEGYRDFHGEDPEEMVVVQTKVHFHKYLSAAGDLECLVIETLDGKYRTTVKFGKGVLLAFNERRNQLFIEGPGQAVDLRDFGINPKDAHELETLGRATRIEYFTNKVHLRAEDGGEAVYGHKFRMTNKDGRHVTVRMARFPDVIYRVRDEHLEFSGGSYKILPEGIDK